jgi:hypothetical protein
VHFFMGLSQGRILRWFKGWGVPGSFRFDPIPVPVLF